MTREATSKSPAQRERILFWLRMRGEQGVLNTELTELCMRFGARIYELRQAGYDIRTERLDESRFRFVLVGDTDALALGRSGEDVGGGLERISDSAQTKPNPRSVPVADFSNAHQGSLFERRNA